MATTRDDGVMQDGEGGLHALEGEGEVQQDGRESLDSLSTRGHFPFAHPTGELFETFGHDLPRLVKVDTLKARFFILGLMTGFALQMFLMAAVLMAAGSHQRGSMEELALAYYPLFRGLFLLCYFALSYGVVLFIWKRTGVCYRIVLDVPSVHNYHAVVRASFSVMCIVFACFALYVLTLTSELTPNKHVWPLAAFGCALIFLVWPWNWMAEWEDQSQRAALLRGYGRVLTAPLFKPHFCDIVLANTLISMPKLLLDFLRMGCLYSTGEVFQIAYDQDAQSLTGMSDRCTFEGSRMYEYAAAILSVLPFWIRLMQCARQFVETGLAQHALNGIKYCCSMSVVILSLVSNLSAHLHNAWLVMGVTSTLFAGWWDLYFDWGHPLLRPPVSGKSGAWSYRLYPRWAFYLAAITNSFARLGWAVLISPRQSLVEQHVILMLGCVELTRRAQWVAYRVEWEQHCLDLDAQDESAPPSLEPSPMHRHHRKVSKASGRTMFAMVNFGSASQLTEAHPMMRGVLAVEDRGLVRW